LPFTCRHSLRFLSIEAAWQLGIIKIDFAEGCRLGCWRGETERKDREPLEVGFSICQTPRNLLNCFSSCCSSRSRLCTPVRKVRDGGKKGREKEPTEAVSVATWDVRLVLQLVFASGKWQKVAIAA